MRFKLTQAPAEEPISLVEAKAVLRVSSTAEDAIITQIIIAARNFCERYTGKVFVTQTWEGWLDRAPVQPARGWHEGIEERPISSAYETKRFIEIDKGPVQSVSSIKSLNDEGTEAAFEASNYIVDNLRTPARVALARSSAWPTDLRPINAIKITFVAGFGAAAAVPQDIKQAMYLLIAHWFENREAMLKGTITAEIDFGVRDLLQQHRTVRL